MRTIRIYTLMLLLFSTGLLAADAGTTQRAQALFAGGCFWCMEPPFEKLNGVLSVEAGYTGGLRPDPTYEAVSSGSTGHVEAVLITYDPTVVSYTELLRVFWRQIDPTDGGGQFVDRGPQYRSVIYFNTGEERRAAEASRDTLAQSGRFTRPIVTEILKAGPFYRAEEYHQDYYRKNPVRYNYYRFRSGRDQFLKSAWDTKKR